jgi:hypothetical protein
MIEFTDFRPSCTCGGEVKREIKGRTVTMYICSQCGARREDRDACPDCGGFLNFGQCMSGCDSDDGYQG